MEVILLDSTENPERKIAYSARLCYSKRKPKNIKDNLSEKEIERMVKMIIENGHLSVLEHTIFTFGVTNISRVASHQLVRNRIASYSHQSLRYNKLKNIDIHLPESIYENKKVLNLISESEKIYKELIDSGISAEDARYILPNGVTSNIIITMNARALFGFFKSRLCLRAQEEIRMLAVIMFNILNEKHPLIFSLDTCGPPCKSEGGCKESVPCFEK